MTGSKPLYDIDHWMVAWNGPGAFGRYHLGAVEVGPWPDRQGWSKKYLGSAGCCNFEWRKFRRAEKLQHIVNGFFVLTLQGLSPQALHREFWKIAEYRKLEMPFLGMGAYIIFQGEGRCDPFNP